LASIFDTTRLSRPYFGTKQATDQSIASNVAMMELCSPQIRWSLVHLPSDE